MTPTTHQTDPGAAPDSNRAEVPTNPKEGNPMVTRNLGLAKPVPRKLLYRVTEVMQVLSISRSQVYEQLRAGRLRSVKQGRTRLIPESAIRDYVELLEREAAAEGCYGETA